MLRITLSTYKRSHFFDNYKEEFLHVFLYQRASFRTKWDTKGVLLDITGVLYESGHKRAINGSVEAIEKLRNRKIPFKFVTNETELTRSGLVKKLQSFGFSLNENEIFCPAVATSTFIRNNSLRPYLLVHPEVIPEFSGCDMSSPNCVVVGDAANHFTYENMNKAFSVLMKTENPLLISMGKGRYFKDKDELVMDLGGFTAALEYSSGVTAKVIGKPDPEFFHSALNDIKVKPDQAVMVGDDISSDVLAAQKCGLRGVLVKTGKFRAVDLEKSGIKPDAVVDDLAHFVDLL